MNIDTILNILQNRGDFELFSEYAEPGYTNPSSGLIAIGNWNSGQAGQTGQTGQDCDMPQIGKILEKLGAELEWSDEWVSCMDCGRLVRTSGNCYGWTRSYWESDDGPICQDCLLDDTSEYLEYLENNPKTANTLDIDLNADYQQINKEYENGLYGGQCDDPQIIAESLRKQGITRFIFQIDGVGQFDLSFAVWVHKSEYHKLNPMDIESIGVDPATMMQKALRSTPTIETPQRNPSDVPVTQCHTDGTATTQYVSRQDFINGKALA